MKRAVFYISDVGWGHATRQIALIKRLVDAGLEVYVRNRSALTLLRSCFGEEIKRGVVHMDSPSSPNDPGWPSSYPIKRDELEERIVSWIKGVDAWISEELSFLKEACPDVVVSDAVAGAFEIAEKFGVPSVFVSNLNWYDEYRYVLGDFELLEIFRVFYQKATHAFILPFESRNTVFRIIERAPLLVREVEPDRVRSIRRSLMENYRPEMIAAFTLGGFYRNEDIMRKAVKAMKEASERARILWLLPEYVRVDGILSYSVKEPDFNSFIAASDFVFAKCGYGVVSEAVSSRIFGVYLYRPQVLEDVCVTQELVLSGWGERCSMDGDYRIPLEVIFAADRDELPRRLKGDGASYIAERIVEKFL